MKKIIVLACLSMLPLSYAAAEGYQVNSQSAKQSGMGHVGAAMKLGAESMHFNPAGLAFMDKNIDLSAGISGVFANAKYTATDGYVAKSDNKASTPMYLYAGFKIYDFLAAGISLNTPYGSAINWGNDWRGAHLVQDISLQAFNIQPTLSWKITDRLSVGAGLMMEFGNIELNRALIGPGELSASTKILLAGNPGMEAMIPQEIKSLIAKYDNVSAASVGLKGDAGVRMGFNVGAMFDVNDKITLGLSYRSKVTARVKEGDVSLSYANQAEMEKLMAVVGQFVPGAGLPPLDKATFSAELPLPDNWNAAITYKPTNRWTVSGEVQFVGWGAYKSLDVKFLPDSELGKYNISAPKNYKNTRIYRLGGQFAATNRLDVRLGAYYDESPVKDDYLNPETPSMDKLGLTAGLSFRPIEAFSIDFAFSYVTGFGRDGSYTDEYMLLKTIPQLPSQAKQRTFAGRYDVYAFTPTIGLSYAF